MKTHDVCAALLLGCVVVFCAGAPACANPCVPPPSGLAGWWRGESNTWDAVSGNDLSPYPMLRFIPSHSTTGKVGVAFQFSGQYYTAPAATGELDVGASAGLTIEGWIKPDSVSTIQPLVEWNGGGGNVGVALVLNPAVKDGTVVGILEAQFLDTNSVPPRMILFGSPSGAPHITTQTWNHVALTYDKSSGLAALYLNGVALAHTNLGTFRPQTQFPVCFGYRLSGFYSGALFRGGMDEVSVYNRALSLTEIQAIVLADSAGKCPPPLACTPPPADVVAWWRGESNVLDSVSGHHGAATQALDYVEGPVGTAFAVNSGYVRVPASSALDVGNQAGFTLEGWARHSTAIFVGQRVTILEWRSGIATQGVNLAWNYSRFSLPGDPPPLSQSPTLEANLVDATGADRLIRAQTNLITFGNWHHVALTYARASGEAALYVNGIQVATTNLGSFTPLTSGDLYLGGYSAPKKLPLPPIRYIGPVVSLDEISLYARALTPTEIRAVFLSRGEGKCTEPPVIVEQPKSLRVNEGGNAVFHVVATGNPELRYQWYSVIRRRPEPITLLGETNTTLILSNVRPYQDESFGYHFVLITNAFGSARSDDILLRVNLPPLADVSTTPTPVIAHNLSNALVVLDATRSKDPNGDPLDYRWQWLGATELLATGAVVTVTLPVGTNALTLTVDDGLATDTQSFVVEVITPADAVARLATLVASTLPKPQPLLATLAAAEAAINRGNMTAALHQLEAFQNKVRAQLLRVNPALADQLIQAAQEVMDHLNGNSRTRGRFVKVEQSAGGKLRLAFVSPRGVAVVVQASTNLVDWENMGVAADRGDGVFEFEDADSLRMPTRFYRVVVP